MKLLPAKDTRNKLQKRPVVSSGSVTSLGFWPGIYSGSISHLIESRSRDSCLLLYVGWLVGWLVGTE